MTHYSDQITEDNQHDNTAVHKREGNRVNDDSEYAKLDTSLICEDDLNASQVGRSKSLEDRKAREMVDDRQFEYWYPSWETWEFRRTLSYWVAMMFVEGSLLFIIGAACSMAEISQTREENERVLVACPYLVGGICFTIGAYAGTL
jgi:hypothetical protein